METDLIDTEYIMNHRIIKIWKTIILIYGILLIYLTSLGGTEKIAQYESMISISSTIFIISGLIIIFLNMFVYLRIGKFTLNNNVMTLNQNKNKSEIDLNTIDTMVFGKEYGKFYYLKVEQSDFIIELNKSQLTDFRKIIDDLNIDIKHRHFSDRIKEWFNKKNTLYNNV